MATGDQFVSIAPKRLLGFLDFRDRWLNYFKKLLEDITENAFAQNGFFSPSATAVTFQAFGPDRIQINDDILGTDAQGHFILTNEFLAGRAPTGSGIPVENTLGVTYSVALSYAEKPSGVQINPRTGFPEFLRVDEHIGVRDEPDLVVDNGDGTMTFRVNTIARPFPDDVTNATSQSGRTVLVWKKIPGKTAGTEPAAILKGSVSVISGNNEITVGTTGINPFGQTIGQASTNPSDYFVLLEGPTVSRHDLSSEPFTLFVGSFVGAGAGNAPTGFDISSQNTLGSAAGDIGQITAPHHGKLKIRTRADSSDADESQIEVQDAASVPRFTIDESGDTNIDGTLNVNGAATLADLVIDDLTVNADADIKGQTHLGSNFDGGVATEGEKPRFVMGPLNSLSGVNVVSHIIGALGAVLDRQVRTAVDSNGSAYWITINAKWDGAASVWRKDQDNETGVGIRVENTLGTSPRIQVFLQEGPDNTGWALTAWSQSLLDWGLNSPAGVGLLNLLSELTTQSQLTAEGGLHVSAGLTDIDGDFEVGGSITAGTERFSVEAGQNRVNVGGPNNQTPDLHCFNNLFMHDAGEIKAAGGMTAELAFGSDGRFVGSDLIVDNTLTAGDTSVGVLTAGNTTVNDLSVSNDLIMKTGSGEIRHQSGGEVRFGNNGRFVGTSLNVENVLTAEDAIVNDVLAIGGATGFTIFNGAGTPAGWLSYSGPVTELGDLSGHVAMFNNANVGVAVSAKSTPIRRTVLVSGFLTIGVNAVPAHTTVFLDDTFTPLDGGDVVRAPGATTFYVIPSSPGGMALPGGLIMQQAPYIASGTNQISFVIHNATTSTIPTTSQNVFYRFLVIETQ